MLTKRLMLGAAVGLAVAVAAAVIIVSTAASGPSETKIDSSSTKAYLLARYSLEQMSKALLSEDHAAVDGLVTGTRAGCAGVLRDAPTETRIVKDKRGASAVRLSTRNLLLLEILTAVEVTFHRPGQMAVGKFANGVGRLRWSNPKLSNIVRSFASLEAAKLMRRIPDFCQDMKTWVASHYMRVPTNAMRAEPMIEASSIRLANALSGLGCKMGYPEQTILRLIAPYQGSSEGLTSNRVEQLETKVSEAETAIVDEAVAQTERVVGLPRIHGHVDATRSSRKINSRRLPSGSGCNGKPSPNIFPVTGSS